MLLDHAQGWYVPQAQIGKVQGLALRAPGGGHSLAPGPHKPVSRAPAVDGTDPASAFPVPRGVDPVIEALDQHLVLAMQLAKPRVDIQYRHTLCLPPIQTGHRVVQAQVRVDLLQQGGTTG